MPLHLGSEEIIWAGGPLKLGKLVLLPATAVKEQDESHATVILSAVGSLLLRGLSGEEHIVMEARPHDHSGSILWIGGNGRAGDIVVLPASATSRDASQAAIQLNGSTGDIILQNADCAEEFAVEGTDDVEPGTVMIIDDSGSLRPSTEAYDRRVAGVVSGAGGARPAIVLDKRPGQSARSPVALVGKVFCKVDAQHFPISVGDLLTTSSTRGHAMKASDPLKAFGAVLGKAMAPLSESTGLIPVLVALQ
jgi:hypothetical protein